ncbi:MAG: aromatic ring-hydroxylating dioxygenase subunit alpha [Myxococcales bacterium]|nr:aromatic ring-hydroxylating dioxygenase subunit alpha [Myxococcales bacterium]
MGSHPFEEIRASYDEGRPLPGIAYRDADVFSVEAETLLRNSWLSVACGQNVAKSGDLFPVRIAGQSLLVVRDRDHEIRVFYNLCRHRGAPLATEKCSARGGRIVCPYHAWSYGLDGELVSAAHFHRHGDGRPSAEERAGLGLLSLRTAVWRDIVFVNLSSDAQRFEDFIRPLDERLANWTASELRPLSSDEYEIQANWKLAAENFIDAYHLPVLHSQIGGGFSGALGTEDVEVSDDIVGFFMPQGYGDGSGQAESPLPRFSGLAADDTLRIEVFSIFPNTLLLVEPDNQQVIVLRPQSPGVTHETFANYLVSDASQTEDLAKVRDEMYRSAIEINDQDAVLLAGLQLTRSMDVGGETQLTQAWDRTNRRFQRLWARKLLAGVG